MNGPDRLPYRTTLFAELLALPAPAKVAADPNRSLLASMIAGQIAESGCLPADLGLGAGVYQNLIHRYFPGFKSHGTLRDIEDIPEWSDLQKLMLDHRANKYPSELLIANIVATACAGRDHLWQDLGLANREELTKLMQVNFPGAGKYRRYEVEEIPLSPVLLT